MELIRVSPRFGILLGSMVLSISFIILDICAVTSSVALGLPDGLNPFWKLAFIFKCFTDTIILDDFKTALDRLKQYKLARLSSVLGGDLENSGALCDDWEQVANWRRDTEYAPWNESTGITHVDREKKRGNSIVRETRTNMANPLLPNIEDGETGYWNGKYQDEGSQSEKLVEPKEAHIPNRKKST